MAGQLSQVSFTYPQGLRWLSSTLMPISAESNFIDDGNE